MENYENNYEAPVMEETPVQEANPYGQDFANYRTEYVSKAEYLKNHAPASFYKTIKVCAIISYVLIGINVLTLIVNPFGILDVAILLTLTLLVHIKKVKGCAIGLLVYGILSCIIGLVSAGVPTGWGWIIIPILYLVQFAKAEKEYKNVYGA